MLKIITLSLFMAHTVMAKETIVEELDRFLFPIKRPELQKIRLSEKRLPIVKPSLLKRRKVVHLKRGSFLHSLDVKKAWQTNRDIYVNALFEKSSDDFFYVLNKDGKKAYLVKNDSAVFIDSVTQMEAAPKQFSTYAPPEKDKIERRTRILDYLMKIGLDFVDGGFLREFEAIQASPQGRAPYLAAETYFNWFSDFQIGLHAKYERLQFLYEEGPKRSGHNFLIGTLLSYNVFENHKARIRFYTGAVTSLWYQLNSRGNDLESGESNQRNFQNHRLLLGVDLGVKKVNQSEFIVGLLYQRQWLRLKNKLSSDLALKANNDTTTSLGLSLGILF